MWPWYTSVSPWRQGDPRALIGGGVHVFTEDTNSNKDKLICDFSNNWGKCESTGKTHRDWIEWSSPPLYLAELETRLLVGTGWCQWLTDQKVKPQRLEKTQTQKDCWERRESFWFLPSWLWRWWGGGASAWRRGLCAHVGSQRVESSFHVQTPIVLVGENRWEILKPSKSLQWRGI